MVWKKRNEDERRMKGFDVKEALIWTKKNTAKLKDLEYLKAQKILGLLMPKII